MHLYPSLRWGTRPLFLQVLFFPSLSLLSSWDSSDSQMDLLTLSHRSLRPFLLQSVFSSFGLNHFYLLVFKLTISSVLRLPLSLAIGFFIQMLKSSFLELPFGSFRYLQSQGSAAYSPWVGLPFL